MIAVGKRVDHRNARVARPSPSSDSCAKYARDDSVHPALEVFRHVANRFALAEMRQPCDRETPTCRPGWRCPLQTSRACAATAFQKSAPETARPARRDSGPAAPSRPRPDGRSSRTCAGLHSMPVRRSFVSVSVVRDCVHVLPRCSHGHRLRVRFGFVWLRRWLLATASLRSRQHRFEFLRETPPHRRRRMMNGGSSRRMCSCVQLMSKPLAQALPRRTARPLPTRSTPSIKPSPRTSRMKSNLPASFSSPARSSAPRSRTFASSFSSSTIVRNSSAAAQTSGPPPNVEPCIPGAKRGREFFVRDKCAERQVRRPAASPR